MKIKSDLLSHKTISIYLKSLFFIVALVLFISSIFSPNTVKADITTGLVTHYTFDEGSGMTVHDSISHNDGIINSTTPGWTQGIIGNGALSFNGLNNYIAVNYSSGLPIYSTTTPYAVSFWFKPTASNTATLFQESNSNNQAPGNPIFEIDYYGNRIKSG